MQFRITPELSTFIAVGYVETHFDEFISSAGDFSGMPFPEAPKWTVSFGADYNHASGFFIGADARHVSGYLARDLQNGRSTRSATMSSPICAPAIAPTNWSITVFSDNVFDEEYFLYKDVIRHLRLLWDARSAPRHGRDVARHQLGEWVHRAVWHSQGLWPSPAASPCCATRGGGRTAGTRLR